MSAVLEDYFGELTTSWFTSLTAGNAQSSLIPASTRALLLGRIYEDAFRRYIGLGDEQDLAAKILDGRASIGVLDDATAVPPLEFRTRLIKDKKFPSPYNIDVLFKRMGLKKILQLVSRRTKSNVELGLRSFMDVRNALAHENPPSVTDEDVSRYLNQIARWIDAFDREFYGHVVRTSGSAYWT
jgi:hypothetical protein